MSAPDRWSRVEALYNAALERAAGERAAFLDTACNGDMQLRRDVESLLAQPTDNGFLSVPIAVAAKMATSPGDSILTGRRIGTYQIQALLGAGGMGEVYRARDTKLGRDVAIKIVPRVFTTDPERLARFEREARTLAALNHPHIGAIYGVEEAEGLRALVLELVEGETLADRLRRGPMPIAEALTVARQIADALDGAHQKGIIHRDLKPANIKVTSDGVVKVLDFGLAKAVTGDGSAPDLTQSPTATVGGTRDGVILGTAAYMSPEQARGQTVDKRTDIWAFGCVLYEMLTGRAAFAANTVSDTIAGVLEREPVWSTLPTPTPPAIRALLKRCLEKDPKRRVRDIGDARIELDDRGRDRDEESSRAASRLPMWAPLVIGLLIGATMVWGLMRSRSGASEPGPTRFAITAPAEAPQIVGAPVSSPDGRHIAFVATNASGEGHLWIRSLDSMTARRIDGTDGASSPFWSPDARFVGFGVPAQGRLKHVDLSTGTIQHIVNISDALEGGAWSTEGVIVFSPDNRVVLHRVSASGGPSQPLTTLDPARRENSHRFPHFLPDGRHFLFTARSDVRENTGIYVGTLGSTERTWLVEAQSSAAYASGHLLFVREGTLLAQRFDTGTRRLSGEPVALAGNVAQSTVGAQAFFSASADGRVLAYRIATEQNNELVWLDRRGARVGSTIATGDFQEVRLAPNGKFAVLTVTDRDTGNRDIRHVDLTSGILTRLTSHPANDWRPVWSPDSTQLAFASDRDGRSTVFRKAGDGSVPEVAIPMASVPGHHFPDDWSPDGQQLSVHSSTPETALDVWVVSIEGRDAREIARSTFQEHSARFSPAGRLIAYVSDESGAPEVYVQMLGKPGRRLVSTSGGVGPRWRGNGRELFFIDGANRLTAVDVGSDEAFEPSLPVVLFDACGSRTPEFHRYEVAADGSRSLWVCPAERRAPSTVTVSIPGLPGGRQTASRSNP